MARSDAVDCASQLFASRQIQQQTKRPRPLCLAHIDSENVASGCRKHFRRIGRPRTQMFRAASYHSVVVVQRCGDEDSHVWSKSSDDPIKQLCGNRSSAFHQAAHGGGLRRDLQLPPRTSGSTGLRDIDDCVLRGSDSCSRPLHGAAITSWTSPDRSLSPRPNRGVKKGVRADSSH
jgi:hypothetical protein